MNKLEKPVTISVYGIGNFGFALLKHLGVKDAPRLKLRAYDRSTKVVNQLRKHRTHPYFHKSTKITGDIDFVSSPKDLVEGTDIIILAISSGATREILANIKPFIKEPVSIVNVAKALDFKTGERLSKIVSDELEGVNFSYSLLAGGTIAKDLFQHEPLGADLASKDKKELIRLKEILKSETLSIYTTTDLMGVEYASALKNVVAIIAGITKGLGFSYGSETHIISRTADSLANTCIKMGAFKETFSIGSQCWGNDLWMSCTGNTRNKEFGVLVGKGMPVKIAVKEMQKNHKTVEGLSTIKVLSSLDGFKDSDLIRGLNEFLIKQKIDLDKFKIALLKSKNTL